MNKFVDFFVAAVLSGTPLLFGTVGEIISEKVGHLNLGVEGMMALGAVAGFMVGYTTDNVILAILAAFLAGALGALIYAFLTVTLMANQNVTGLTLTIFGVGLSNFIGEIMLKRSATGTLKIPETISAQIANVHIPFFSDIPVIGKMFFSYNIFVYLAVIIAVGTYIYLEKTYIGRNIRAIGENPATADATGVPVIRLKYQNLLLGGGICGIGGAYVSLIICGGVWLANSVNGIGWIAVALVIFASWNAKRAIWGSLLFGAFKVLRYYVPHTPSFAIPNAIFDMLPFLITALVLIVSSVSKKQNNVQPAAMGLSYYREER